jgi:hypothetical protein
MMVSWKYHQMRMWVRRHPFSRVKAHAMVIGLWAVLVMAQGQTTVAEASGFATTGRYDEVEQWCRVLPQQFRGQARCFRFGTTPLGRPMLGFALSLDGVSTPDLAKAKGRPVFFAIGGIHAGEIDGKDALLPWARELLRAKAQALKKATLVFVPVFNVDGHERFGPNQRPNQRGPAETGWRVTSQNLNLNRDWAKADAPEMQAMLTLLQKWDPELLADLHVTDGAKFQHDVSVTLEPRRQGALAVRSSGQALQEVLFTALRAQGHLPIDFYPSFVREDDPSSGFASSVPSPRFSQSYWAVHNRLSMLVETHSWRPFSHRVATTRHVLEVLLAQTAKEGMAWREAMKVADAAASTVAGQSVVLLTKPSSTTRTIDFLGYAYSRTPSTVSGQPWVQYDESVPQVWKVPLADELTPALQVTSPSGYFIPPPHAEWVSAKLSLHGIRWERVGERVTELEVFRGVPQFRAEPFEGRHTLLKLDGRWTKESVTLPAGTVFVPVNQPLSTLVLHLFEPSSPESLVMWGAFNAHFERKEYLEDYLTEAYARELLADAGVKAEFDAFVADGGAQASPAARLGFFSSRHPSADPHFRRVPVFRGAR